LAKLHLKTHIRDVISDLTVIEEQIKTHPKLIQDNSKKKQLKNLLRAHNGTINGNIAGRILKTTKEIIRTKK
jgi:hypothetical protein